MDLGLKNKNILLFGGHSNIGRCVTLAFAQEGAGVTIAGRDLESCEKVALEALEAGAPWAEIVKCDATSYEETAHAAESALLHGAIDSVYHGVGWDSLGKFLELDRNLWQKIYEINFLSCMNAWKYILPIMQKQGHGNFVNNASTCGRVHDSDECVYGALKSAVIHLAQTIAQDVAKDGIRINSVAPGATPPIDGHFTSGSPWPAFTSNPETLEYWKTFSPLGQVGTPWDVAYAVLFLASDITGRHQCGQVIGVDGGRYMPK